MLCDDLLLHNLPRAITDWTYECNGPGGNPLAGCFCPRFLYVEDAVKTKQVVLDDGLLAISSLSRALDGTAQLSDVGALMWVLLRQVVPCDSLALYLPDDTHDHVVVRYAAGAHAHALRGVTRPTATGVAGWVAVNRTPVVNAEPILDLGFRAGSAPALRSSLVLPLVDSDAVIAVLSLYSKELLAFTDDHLRVLELLAPRLAASLIDAVIAEEDAATARSPLLRLVKPSVGKRA
jgi:GAF domain-containing protein